MPIGALINAGTSLLGGVFGQKAAKRNRDHQTFLAKYQYDRNLDMYNRNNEYNTPLNQRKRFEEAGINPHFGIAGGNAGNSSGNIPQYQAPDSRHEDHFGSAIAGAIDSFVDLRRKQTETKILQQTLRKEASQADREEILTELAKDSHGVRKILKDNNSWFDPASIDNFKRKTKADLLNYQGLTAKKKYENLEGDIQFQNEKQRKTIQAMGLENVLKKYRNELAEDGLTFTSNDWAVIVERLIDFISKKVKK